MLHGGGTVIPPDGQRVGKVHRSWSRGIYVFREEGGGVQVRHGVDDDDPIRLDDITEPLELAWLVLAAAEGAPCWGDVHDLANLRSAFHRCVEVRERKSRDLIACLTDPDLSVQSGEAPR